MKHQRCCALDNDGLRCKQTDVKLFFYHGHPELYGHYVDTPAWVVVALCLKHSGTGNIFRASVANSRYRVTKYVPRKKGKVKL